MAFIVCRLEDGNGNLTVERAQFLDRNLKCEPDRIFIRDVYLNSGKNGTVYTCHLETDLQVKKFAVKFLHVLTAQRVARFDFECHVLEGLEHPRVLQLIDAGEVVTSLRSRSIPFLITDLLDGNLDGLVKSKDVLSGDEVKKYGIEICEGFSFVHQKGIIHRDIKPGNFFLKQNSVVIGDFGLAKTATDEGEVRFYRDDLTFGNEIIGPQAFMSPELLRYARNKRYPVDHRSDLWQVGAVLWFCLTGFPPTSGIDEQDDPSGGRFYPVLSKAMKHRPDDRFQSADEFLHALHEI